MTLSKSFLSLTLNFGQGNLQTCSLSIHTRVPWGRQLGNPAIGPSASEASTLLRPPLCLCSLANEVCIEKNVGHDPGPGPGFTAGSWHQAGAAVFHLFSDQLYFYLVTFREISQASSRCPAGPLWGEGAGRFSPDSATLLSLPQLRVSAEYLHGQGQSRV